MSELRRLDRLFEASLLALVLLPFGMIAGGGGLSLFMAIFFAVGLVASLLFHKHGLARPEQTRWWNIVILVFVGYSLLDLVTTDTAVLDAAINIVLVLILIKLFSRQSERDEMQIYALTFLMLAAATTVNEDLVFGLLFALYVLVGTFSLAIFHLRSELRRRPRLALYGRLPFNRQYMGVLAGISALILAASLAIFFVFPRIGLGLFREQARDGVSMAGFSEEVELGGHGAIRDNPQVVMRVEFPDGAWPDLETTHWRTITFDTYDGRGWSQSRKSADRFLPRIKRGTYDLTGLYPSGETRGTIQIYLEPLGTNLLPTVWPAQQIRLGTEEVLLPFGPRSGHVRADRYGDIRHTVESELGVAYVLTVGHPVDVAPYELREPHEVYTQTPPMTPRVRELARKIGSNGAANVDERAVALEEHIRDTYEYTLDLPGTAADPIDSFLFETRRGHCEYFASSLVMLLRLNNIPARLVNGFLGGRWNEVGGYFAVRQGDAHSWVEYWSPGRGWVPLDPTPAGAGAPDASFIDGAREYWDAMRLYWTKWVIEYDLTAQVEFFRRAARLLEPVGLTGGGAFDREEESRAERGDRDSWRLALIVGGLLTIAFVAYTRVRRRLQLRRSGVVTTIVSVFFITAGAGWMGIFQGLEGVWLVSGGGVVGAAILVAAFRAAERGASLEHLFERIETAAARLGLARDGGEGPSAYLRRLAAAQPHLATDLDRFERHYLRARFSGQPPEPDELDRLRSLSARIAGGLRKTDVDDRPRSRNGEP